MGIWVKDQARCTELVFCQAVAWQNHWRQYVLPAPLFAIFRTGSLLSLPESEIRAGKLLVDPWHLQEDLVGGRPHHRYRRACRRRPGVDRVLQKNTHIADDYAKILPEASVSLK